MVKYIAAYAVFGVLFDGTVKCATSAAGIKDSKGIGNILL